MDSDPPGIAILLNAARRDHAVAMRASGKSKMVATKIAHLIGLDKALAGNDHMLVVDDCIRMLFSQIERPPWMHLYGLIKAAERRMRLLLR